MAEINGTSGNDSLYGTDANDTLNGYEGDDWLDGRLGDDTLNGGDGTDRTSLSFYYATSGVTYTLADGAVATSNGTKTLNSIEDADIAGSQYADTITGGSATDRINGYSGDDTLNGAGGTDWLNGGLGNDTAIFAGARADYEFTAANGWVKVTNIIDGSIDYVLSIETFHFSDGAVLASDVTVAVLEGTDGSESLHGSYLNDTINAGAGNDWVHGQDGNDTLNGGDGNDYLHGGGNGGSDTLNGDAGDDYLDGGGQGLGERLPRACRQCRVAVADRHCRDQRHRQCA